MHTLIGRLVAIRGVDRAAADTAAGIFRPTRRRGAAAAAVIARVDRWPGAGAATQKSRIKSRCVSVPVIAAGWRADEVAPLTRETIGHARHLARELAVDDSVGAVPGRFV